jgi:hypothetical protein
MLRGSSHAAQTWFWVIAPVILLVGPSVVMSHTGVQLALNDASPNPLAVGRLNAIALTGNGVVRAAVPGLTTAIFAIGVTNEIIWGNLAWVILIVLSVAFYALVHQLPDNSNCNEGEQ